MGEREKDPRIQELLDQGKEVYSISKLDTINNCLYGAYRTYKLKQKGSGNVYSILGGATHDVLEQIINGEKTEAELLPMLHNELNNLEMLGIDFPKDRNGGTSIRQGWISNMEHFCSNFTKPNGEFETETLFIYKTNEDVCVQGYIDLTRFNKDGTLTILDWKTSSAYGKDTLKEHGRQLVMYALGKEQEGYSVKQVAWIMLKYVNISFMGKARANSKKETLISKVVERRKIALELKKYVESDLCDLGYDDADIDIMLKQMMAANSLDNLPGTIRDKYKIKPHVLYYDLTEELKRETITYANNTARLWESLGDDEKNYPPRSFYKTNKYGKTIEDTFFCINLCNHGSNCPHLQRFLQTKNTLNSDDEELF